MEEKTVPSMNKGVPRSFHWELKPNGLKLSAGYGFWGGGRNPFTTSQKAWGRAVSSPAGFGQSPDRPKVFHYFQHSEWPLLTL